MTSRTAIIGAGLSCARESRRAGRYVDIFEANSSIGGRVSTMRVGVVPYDHGAQYITGHSSIFRGFITELVEPVYAARWKPGQSAEQGNRAAAIADWFVGIPVMSSILRPLAQGVRIHTSRVVHTLSKAQQGWRIWFDDRTSVEPFSAVAICVPAPQAQLLLGPLDEIASQLSRVRMSPCWSLMVRLDERVLPEKDIYFDLSELIRWVARNNAKPGRTARGETVVVHASPSWSREGEDADPEIVAEEILGEVSHILSLPPIRPTQMTAHLWRYGLVEEALGESYVYSSEDRVGVAGDCCLGRIAEHAFESGEGLGYAINSSLD